MYFVKKGKVEVLSESSVDGLFVREASYTIDRVIQKDDFFGDECLAWHRPHRYTVRAVTHVDLFALKESWLLAAFSSYPEDHEIWKKNIQNMSSKRL